MTATDTTYYLSIFDEGRTLIDRAPFASLAACLAEVTATVARPKHDHVPLPFRAGVDAAGGIYEMFLEPPAVANRARKWWDTHVAWLSAGRPVTVIIERADRAAAARAEEVAEGNRPAPLRRAAV